jgi:hypothetical protein
MVETLKRISELVILLFLLNACKSKDDDLFLIGNDLVSKNSLLVEIDTFTVNLSTIRQDSLPTSGNGVLLAGNYDDGHFGKITCNSVFSVGIPTVTEIINTDIYDSISLTFKYSGYYYGDTTIVQSISVHKLKENIKFSDGYYLYNSSKSNFDPSSLGIITKVPTPHNKNSISIKLNNSLGIDIFNKLKNNSDIFLSDEAFLTYLPGLILLADKSKSSSVIGYGANDSTMIRLYFHELGASITLKEYDFPLINPSYQYNQIYSDHSGLPISSLTDQRKRIASSANNNESLMQAGSGLMTRVDFPYLGKLLEFERKGKILSAELIFKPVKNSYNNYVSLPDSLVLFTTDKLNKVNGYITNNSSTYEYAYLYIDDLYNANTQYSVDITTYLFAEFSGNYYNVDHGLLVGLRPSLFETTLDRLILSGPDNPDSKPQLKIKYIFYD